MASKKAGGRALMHAELERDRGSLERAGIERLRVEQDTPFQSTAWRARNAGFGAENAGAVTCHFGVALASRWCGGGVTG